ncbi:TatA/E family twin arginine-targeting protein translocase [Microseira wollei]|uniref:Sec-independent protein translocase protein TatA n=1 Tax=Microseira wollei NIES-4236 TaxID=2530354 RepID=A0AAV3X5N7_9CYAN|nr:TatA/E family twin arginine-targeting protein translocase [Microseira wollei]GET35910.1 twin arginine-targeting protein translocase [Microseira wollei NIES-4236]
MFGLGLPEMGIIVVVALLIFGPKKIPEMGRALAKTLRGFKEEMSNPENDKDAKVEETTEDKTKT